MEASSLTDARSAALYARAQAVLPGGVNSPVRAMRAIGRDPIFVERPQGAELTDVDGNRYVDWVCSWGPLVHGHAHPEVLAAVRDAAGHGTTFGAPTAGEVELAEEVARRVPSVQMLRMTSSGTEAAMSAIRLARAVTGREKLLKFAGAYHGHVDGLLAQAGSGLATQALPASPGVPQAATAGTVIVAVERLRTRCARRWPSTGSPPILAEPYPANMGLVPPEPGFLELLREGATANGALLVFDEVITGFRVAPGGAQDLTGVTPDLTVMGKVIGGGLPAAAFGGRREHLERLAPAGDVYQAGTLSGNPLAVAAGLTTLRLLDEQAHLRLSATTEALADGLREAAAAAGRAGAGRHGARPADRLLQRRAGARLRRGAGVRPRGLRRLVPRPAGPRRLPAAVAVRGLVPLAGPHRRARRAHGRGGGGRVRGGRGVTAGASRSCAGSSRCCATRAVCWPERWPTPTAPRPPRGARGRRPALGRPRGGARARRRGDPRGLPPALRRGRGWSAPTTATWPCWPATGSTRSGSRAWPPWATSTPSASWPTSSR